MKSIKLTISDIEISVEGEEIKFTLYHDLPNITGLSLQDAVDNWIPRTLEYTAESLCKYIMSKNSGYICITEEQFKEIQNS